MNYKRKDLDDKNFLLIYKLAFNNSLFNDGIKLNTLDRFIFSTIIFSLSKVVSYADVVLNIDEIRELLQCKVKPVRIKSFIQNKLVHCNCFKTEYDEEEQHWVIKGVYGLDKKIYKRDLFHGARYWLRIPKYILDNENKLSYNEMLILGYINNFKLNKHQEYSSNAKLAKMLDIPRRSIIRSLTKLERLGFIKVKYQSNGHSTKVESREINYSKFAKKN